MSMLEYVAIAVIILTVYALAKRMETRLVLFTAGFFLCVLAMNPLAALNSFASSMAKGSLIMAICSSMGFAFVSQFGSLFSLSDSRFRHLFDSCLHAYNVCTQHCYPVCCRLFCRCRFDVDSRDASSRY